MTCIDWGSSMVTPILRPSPRLVCKASQFVPACVPFSGLGRWRMDWASRTCPRGAASALALDSSGGATSCPSALWMMWSSPRSQHRTGRPVGFSGSPWRSSRFAAGRLMLAPPSLVVVSVGAGMSRFSEFDLSSRASSRSSSTSAARVFGLSTCLTLSTSCARARQPSERRRPAVAFVGNLTKHHQERAAFLDALSRRVDVDFYGGGSNSCPRTVRCAPVPKVRSGETIALTGVPMVTTKSSYTRTSMLRPESSAKRLFEATGMGATLLVEEGEGLAELFEPGVEVLVYRDLGRSNRPGALTVRDQDASRAIGGRSGEDDRDTFVSAQGRAVCRPD